jgi:5-methylcytosine-specific restriction protein A
MASYSKLDEEVFREFSTKAEQLKGLAMEIRSIAADPFTSQQILQVEDDEQTANEEIVEGQIIYKLHKTRERDKKIVAVKKNKTLSESGKLDCEACAFDFYQYYGDIGYRFIECHHRTPLNLFKKESITTLQDLALVCSNCHRMIHKQISTLTVEHLRRKLEDENKRFSYQ